MTGGGIGVERVVGDKVGRLILRRGEQKDPRASRPRRRKPGTRKTPPSHVDHPLLPHPLPRFSIVLLSLLSTHTMANTDLADAFIHLFHDEPSPSTKKELRRERICVIPYLYSSESLISGSQSVENYPHARV